MKKDEKLRVLHLVPKLGKGGAERFAIDLCNELHKRADVDVIFAALDEENLYGGIVQVPVHCLNNSYVPSIFGKPKGDYQNYIKLVDEFKPHVIHTHLFFAEIFSLCYLKPEISYVVHGHDNMFQFANFSTKTLSSKYDLTNFYEKQLLARKKYNKFNTWFLTNSTHTQNFYRSTVPSKIKDQVKLMYYGFDFERFYNSAEKKISTGKIKLTNIGHFGHPKKNQGFLVDIANELRSRNVDFVINVLGDGKLRPPVEAAIKKHNLENHIILRGNVMNVEEYLAETDIYLHTAWYEPFGLIFLEAFAGGIPCITLDGKGCRDLFQKPENGFLIYNQNAKEFADKIEYYIKNPEIYKATVQDRKDYAKTFDIKTKAGEFLDFYKSIAQ